MFGHLSTAELNRRSLCASSGLTGDAPSAATSFIVTSSQMANYTARPKKDRVIMWRLSGEGRKRGRERERG